MSDIECLQAEDVAYLGPYLPIDRPTSLRPHVTLTYAMSLDGLISINPGFRTIISGQATKNMTHYLRLKHDAILVGSNTAKYDDPALNCRYPGVTFNEQPQPVILDADLSWRIAGKKVMQLCRDQKGKTPWVLSRSGTKPPVDYPQNDVEVISIPSEDKHLDWSEVFSQLRRRGIRSVMVEGGASILKALLLQPALIDSVVVTIGPTWLGTDGSSAHVAPNRHGMKESAANAASIVNGSWRQFGNDMVLCGQLVQKT